jgi:hypothetical protein
MTEDQHVDVATLARAWLKAHADDSVRDQILFDIVNGSGVVLDAEKAQVLQVRRRSAADQTLASLVANNPEAAWQVVLEMVRTMPPSQPFVAGLEGPVALLLRGQPELFIARLGAELSIDDRWLDVIRVVASLAELPKMQSALSDDARQQLQDLAKSRR